MDILLLRLELRVAGWLVLAGLTIAIVCMATARNWGVII
jgi:hypothetical protein